MNNIYGISYCFLLSTLFQFQIWRKIFQKPSLVPFCTENPILNVEITVYPNFYKWQKYPFNTGLFFHVCVYERSIPMHRDLLQSFQTNRDYTSKLPFSALNYSDFVSKKSTATPRFHRLRLFFHSSNNFSTPSTLSNPTSSYLVIHLFRDTFDF